MNPGSIRHSLLALGLAAAATELALALVGGLDAAADGAVLLLLAALVTARYVSGAASQDSGFRWELKLMDSRAAGLGELYWTVKHGLDEDGYESVLRPRLQRLYAARLSERHNVSLHGHPERAATLLGPDLWPWIAPDRPAPAATIPVPVLDALVDRLETL